MWTMWNARLSSMRWERLFADLDAQFEAAAEAELSGEVADRSRREMAQVALADRLRSAEGSAQFGVLGSEPVSGEVTGCGPDWILLAGDGGVEMLVPLAVIIWVRGLSARSEPETSVVRARLGLGYVLRGLARDRAEVTLVVRSGERLTGTIDRVGADVIDLAEHPLGEPRRAAAVTSARAIPFAALSVLRRQ